MGGGNSKPPASRLSAGPSSRQSSSSPTNNVKRSRSGVIDLSQSKPFSHRGDAVDDGSQIPPSLSSQLLSSLDAKHRPVFGGFFASVQANSDRQTLTREAGEAVKTLARDHALNTEKGLRAAAAAIQDAVNVLKWPLDAMFGGALMAVEAQAKATNAVWTELSMGELADLLLMQLTDVSDKPKQAQSVQLRSLLVRSLQALSDSVDVLGNPLHSSGLRHTLPADCFLSLSLSQFLRAISPFLLEKSQGGAELLERFRRSCDAKLFTPETPLEQHMAVLDAVGKELFLNLYIGQRVPVDVVLARETVFEDLVASLRTDEAKPLERASVVTLRAYFKSEYGKKTVDGVQVEEGEGLGPRKEFYSLASLFLQSAWKDKVALAGTVSVAKGETRVVGVGTDFTAKVRPGMLLSMGVGEDDSPQNETAIVAEVASDTELTLERRVQTAHSAENAWAMAKTDPLFVYSKTAEAYYYNPALPDSDDHRTRFTVVGRMIAAALADRCKLDTVLAEPLFAQLMQPDLGRSYQPTQHDLLRYDPALAKQVTSVRKLSKSQLQELIEDSDLDGDIRTADEYVAASCKDMLLGPCQWQAEALHRGFSLGAKSEWWKQCPMSPLDLQSIVCGAIDTTADFDFRKVFRVVEDQELQRCAPLQSALWDTVDALDRVSKRKLLRFITGVDRLPSPGTEMIKVEMPFTAFSEEEHKRTLLMMPQAHTCDNILELPNYWESLQKIRGVEDPEGADTKLVAELKDIIRDKVSTAFSLSDGFGLDMAFDD